MKTRLFLFALVVGLAASLAGCGQAPATPPSNAPVASATLKPAEPTQASAPTEQPPAATSAAGETAELRLWINESAPFKTAYQVLIDAYTAQHPNVKITIESFEYDTYIQTLQTAMPAKQEADIISMFGTWVCSYGDRLATVPESVITLEEAQKLYFAAPLGGYTCDGKMLGLPQEFNIEYGGVIVNKAMYEAAGLTWPPKWKTMDDVIADAQKMTVIEDGVMKQAGFSFLTSDPIAFSFLAGILQRGGDYWNKDHTAFTFNTPEAKQMLEWMRQAVVDKKVGDPATMGGPDADPVTIFFSGQAAMQYIGPWAISEGLANYPDFGELGYFQLPNIAGDKPLFAADSGWGLSVSPNSQHQDVAWDFVKFVAVDPANALAFNVTTQTLPAIKENAAAAGLAEKVPAITAELPLLPYGRYLGTMPDRDQVMYSIIAPHITNVMQGLETVDEALQKMEDEANATLNK
jgi:multiple sugar transport system substrate-binding protein